MSLSKHCSISESLRCPICTDFPEAEVYQCKNGHVICQRCSERVVQCPECRVDYGTGLNRNRVMEDLLQTVEVDCPNKNDESGTGCVEKVKLKDLQEHSSACSSSGIKTQIQLCKLLGYSSCGFLIDFDISSDQDFRTVRDHFIKSHHAVLKFGRDVLVNFANFRHRVSATEAGTVIGTQWSPIILNLDGTPDGPAFLICMMLHSNDSKNLCWFNLFLGSKYHSEGQVSSDGATKNYDLVVTVPGKLLPLSWENFHWRFPFISLSTTTFRTRTTLEKALRARPFRTPLDFLQGFRERDENFLQLKLEIITSKATQNPASASTVGAPFQEIMWSFDMDITRSQTSILSTRSSSSSDATPPHSPLTTATRIWSEIVAGMNQADEGESWVTVAETEGDNSSTEPYLFSETDEHDDDDSSFMCCFCRIWIHEYPRYCCMQCEGFYICNGCYNNQGNLDLGAHKDHVFVMIETEIQMGVVQNTFIPGQQQPQLSELPDFCKGSNYLPRCHNSCHESPGSSAPVAIYVCMECSTKPWSFCSDCTRLSRGNRSHHPDHILAVLDTNERSEVFKYLFFKGLLPKVVGYWE